VSLAFSSSLFHLFLSLPFASFFSCLCPRHACMKTRES
jgi:hypothetical protein